MRSTILLILLSSTILGGCSGPVPSGASGEVPPVIVYTLRPVRRDAVYHAEAQGKIRAARIVDIRAPATGQLIPPSVLGDQKAFSEGREVAQGDLLFLIAQKTNALEGMFAAERKLNSQLKAMGEMEARGQQPTKAHTDAVAKSRQALSDAVDSLDCVPVRAPIAGVIGERLKKDGETVTKGEDSLAVITDSGPFEVVFELDERVLSGLLAEYSESPDKVIGRQLEIQPQHENTTYSARLSFINNRVDADSGRLRLVARMDKPITALRDGQAVTVRIPLIYSQDALLVQHRAIQADSTGTFIWVVSEEGILGRRPVEVGPMNGKLRIVALPPEGGEQPRLSRDDNYVVSASGLLSPEMTATSRPYDADEDETGE